MNSEEIISLLTFICVLVTAVSTGYLAVFSYKQILLSKKQNQQKATIDLIISNNNNPLYSEHRKKFLDMKNTKEDFTALACKLHSNDANDDEKEKNDIIISLLNNTETICVGIREGIFSEELFKRMCKSSFLNDYNALQVYIAELRNKTGYKKLFCEIEWLATKWQPKDSED